MSGRDQASGAGVAHPQAALQQRVPWITPELGRQAVEAALRSLKDAMGAAAAQPAVKPAAHSAVTFVRK